jgi:hypothetical protein
MRLTAERGIDGVTVVYAINHDGTKVAVADFWLTPLVDGWNVSRAVAEDYQRQFAMLLVTAHNKIFTRADRRGQDPRIDEEDAQAAHVKGDTPPAYTHQPANEMPALLEAARAALHEMRHTVAPRDEFTDAVDLLDAAISKAVPREPATNTGVAKE